MNINEINWIHDDLSKIEGHAESLDAAPEHTARQRKLITYVQNVRRLMKLLFPRDLNEAPTRDEQ